MDKWELYVLYEEPILDESELNMHNKLKDTHIDHMYSTMHVCVQEYIKMCELSSVRNNGSSVKHTCS